MVSRKYLDLREMEVTGQCRMFLNDKLYVPFRSFFSLDLLLASGCNFGFQDLSMSYIEVASTFLRKLQPPSSW